MKKILFLVILQVLFVSYGAYSAVKIYSVKSPNKKKALIVYCQRALGDNNPCYISVSEKGVESKVFSFYDNSSDSVSFYKSQLIWSPDSKYVVFFDFNDIYSINIKSKEPYVIYKKSNGADLARSGSGFFFSVNKRGVIYYELTWGGWYGDDNDACFMKGDKCNIFCKTTKIVKDFQGNIISTKGGVLLDTGSECGE